MFSPLCCGEWVQTESSSPSSCRFSWGLWASYPSFTQSLMCVRLKTWWQLVKAGKYHDYKILIFVHIEKKMGIQFKEPQVALSFADSWSYLVARRGRHFWFLLKSQLWGGEEMQLLTPSKTACPSGVRASSEYKIVRVKWWHAEVSSTKW